MSQTNIISLKELGQIINTSLPKDKLIVKAEVRQPKKYNSGHTYLELKDDDNIIKAIVLKSNNTINIKDGDMVEAQGKIEYYSNKGNMNFVINKIKLIDTVGEMLLSFDTMNQFYKENGYYDNKMVLPNFIKKILILTSENGAAIHDFNYVIESSNISLDRTLVDVPVQGPDSPIQIANVLSTYNIDCYDMVVITRGGGSMEDLWGFNDKNIIESVHKCKKPVLSAIGHTTDTTLLDFVSTISRPTPSLAAQFIVDHNNLYIDRINKIKDTIYLNLVETIKQKINRLDEIVFFYKNNRYKKLLDRMKVCIITSIQNKINSNNNILLKYKTANDSISIYKNNIEVKNSIDFNKIIDKKDEFTIMWNNVRILITEYKMI